MGLFDVFFPKKCRRCQELEQEIAALKEASRMAGFVSESVRKVAEPPPQMSQAPETKEGCALVCSLNNQELLLSLDGANLFQVLNEFYGLTSKAVRSHQGLIERFDLAEISLLFYGDTAQENCYRTCEALLVGDPGSRSDWGLSLFPVSDRFLTGILGEPDIRLDFAAVSSSLLRTRLLATSLPSGKENALFLPEAEKEAFEKCVKRLAQAGQHRFRDRTYLRYMPGQPL